MERTAVVIGRFQVGELTEGHTFLIDYALSHSEKLVIVIGESPTRLTTKHPLNYEIREQMIKELYPEAIVLKLNDYHGDDVWSEKLDELIAPYHNITIYCSRDGFNLYYKGKQKVLCVNSPIPEVSGTEERKAVLSKVKQINNRFFRWGAIWATQYKFPTMYPCVDIGILRYNIDKSTDILIGRKPNESKFRLAGGFVDPSDESLEDAAFREMTEELGPIQIHELKYVCSKKVNDWRYKGSSDKMMTSLFVAYKLAGQEQAGDDLEEIKWVNLNSAEDEVFDGHKTLIQEIKKYEKKYNS